MRGEGERGEEERGAWREERWEGKGRGERWKEGIQERGDIL